MSDKNKLQISEGEFKYELTGYALHDIGLKYKIKSGDITIAEVKTSIGMQTDVEVIANTELFTDAGTTANKCGLLPSELLKQRDEFIEMLKYYTKHYEETNATKKLIQSIESNKCGSCNGSGLVDKYNRHDSI